MINIYFIVSEGSLINKNIKTNDTIFTTNFLIVVHKKSSYIVKIQSAPIVVERIIIEYIYMLFL